MTTTDPSVPSAAPQPAPLDLIGDTATTMRVAADRLASAMLATGQPVYADQTIHLLRRWADELDAAPAAPRTYGLPVEPPPEVVHLWDWEGVRWDRTAPRTWQRAIEADDPWWRRWTWLRLLDKRGPLSTVPPAGTEPDDA